MNNESKKNRNLDHLELIKDILEIASVYPKVVKGHPEWEKAVEDYKKAKEAGQF